MSDTPRILRFACIDSTNTEARGRALSGERGPLWLCADRQTAGRGRRGREWTSVDGNLFTTGLYTLEHTPGQAAELSFAAALSAAEVCDSVLGDRERTKLKWPNDVLVDRKKAAGLLLESGDAPGGGLWLAIGVGLNLVSHPEDAERPATDLSEAGGELDRDTALDRLIAAFETWRRRWLDFGFAPIRDAWLARAHGLGEACEARLQGETVKGVFADLAQDGALRLDLAGGGRRYISAGEVYFPDRG
jgi:BirA family biotin operon repressor/biotin-[acetyl-CoA-carboxylase] ligase